jgi:exosortase F-associated protein
MLQRLLQNKVKVLLFLGLVFLLVLIRSFEDALFYDPFLDYFKSDYTNKTLPVVNHWFLFLGLTFRYFLNTVISLFIIVVVFQDFELTKFAGFLYLLFFSILMLSFFVVLQYYGETNKMTLFYIRRFLIQPLFLILFLPAFFYQKQVN